MTTSRGTSGWGGGRTRRWRRVDVDRRRAAVMTVMVVLAVTACTPARAFGPRPRPRLYEKPIPSRRLLEAELALRELGPGGPAAAGLLSDGHWLGGEVENDGDEVEEHPVEQTAQLRGRNTTLGATAAQYKRADALGQP